MPPEPLQIPDLGFPSTDEPKSLGENLDDLSIESASSPFLKNIPDQDKAIVQKYIKDWDSQVTKRFQGIHDEYKPYKDLGDIESIQRNMEIVQLLQADPKLFYTNLAKFIDQIEGNDEVEIDDTEEVEPVVPKQVEKTDPRDSELADLRNQVQQLTGAFTNDIQSRNDQRELAQLDRTLENLHTKHGDFDDDWVLVQVSRGVPIENAIKSWNDMLGQRVDSFRKATPPRIMPGAGNTAGSQVDPSRLDKKTKINYIQSALEAANQ